MFPAIQVHSHHAAPYLLLGPGIIVAVSVILALLLELVLVPFLELKTGIVALNSGDLSERQLLTGLSAHDINMTPGQMVIDIADGGVHIFTASIWSRLSP